VNVAAAPSPDSVLVNIQTVVETVASAVTATALVIGGLWAYFKFVKNRTYRPRLDVELSGQWRQIDQQHFLQARISVKNIGASKIDLVQHGTGLRINTLGSQVSAAGSPAPWHSQGVLPLLIEHAWIEPGETVTEDQLIRAFRPAPELTLFQSRLVWRLSGHEAKVAVLTSRIVPIEGTIEPATETK